MNVSIIQSYVTCTHLLPILADVLCEREGSFTVEEIVGEVERRKGVALKEGESSFITAIFCFAVRLFPRYLTRVSSGDYRYVLSGANKAQVEKWFLDLAQKAREMKS